MVDGGAQVFKLAASSCLRDGSCLPICFFRLARFPLLANPPFHIGAAKLAANIGQCVRLPEIGKCQSSLFRFLWARMLWRNLGQIKIQNVED
jgi:hypothetical protein